MLSVSLPAFDRGLARLSAEGPPGLMTAPHFSAG